MPDTEIDHRESWHLTIRPDEGEIWPDQKVTYTNITIRPDVIYIHFDRGQGFYTGSVAGYRIKQDGTPGVNRSREIFSNSGSRLTGKVPEWVADVVGHELLKHKLIGKVVGHADHVRKEGTAD